jgi:hypothetical protein
MIRPLKTPVKFFLGGRRFQDEILLIVVKKNEKNRAGANVFFAPEAAGPARSGGAGGRQKPREIFKAAALVFSL